MTSPVPPSADPILDPLMRNRPALGYVFAALALGFLIGGGYCFNKAYGEAPSAEKSTDDDKPKLDSKDVGPDVDTKLLRPYTTEYSLGGVIGLLCALACGGTAGWLLGRLPDSDIALERRYTRLLLFASGGILGIAFMVLGFALFYLWFGELAKWLGQAEKTEPIKPLLATLAFLIGAGLVFAGVQPLRAEERNDLLLRRIAYGANFFLTTLLLVVALIFVNVVTSLKLPAKLDTSESGFYTLSGPTTEYLKGLEQDIVIYTTIQETSREGIDVIRVLNAFQDANPKRVKLKHLSLTLDKSEIASLKTKFPTADIVDAEGGVRLGVIVALGSDEKRYQFIAPAELFGREGGQQGQGPAKKTFQCEPRIIREILFQTEKKSKPVIYFTQGAGELSIDPPGPTEKPTNYRPGSQLKAALVADYCDVKTLKFEALAVDPKVPDDATVVVIADPSAQLSESMVTALRRYMSAPKPDGSKGKLLVMAGAHPQPGQKRAVQKLGIEEILAEYGVAPYDRVLYSKEEERIPAEVVFLEIPKSLVAEKNTIALAFGGVGFAGFLARPIDIDDRNPKYKVRPLLVSTQERVSWVEEEIAESSRRAWNDLVSASNAGRKDVIQRKQVTKSPRVVAAVSSEAEGNTGRVVVFGYGQFDDVEKGEDGRLPQSELIAASINWLRDRPAVANEGSKPYGVYAPNPKYDWLCGFTLPVVLVMLGISTVGLGLWVLRRR